jgi:hypothetical protein
MSLISSQDWRGASTVVFSHELVLDFFLAKLYLNPTTYFSTPLKPFARKTKKNTKKQPRELMFNT